MCDLDDLAVGGAIDPSFVAAGVHEGTVFASFVPVETHTLVVKACVGQSPDSDSPAPPTHERDTASNEDEIVSQLVP